MKTSVVIGNIIGQSDAHAIVNSASRSLRKGSGISAAIHTSAGPELEAYCCTLAPVAPGGGVITPGFGLHNSFVIHIVSGAPQNESNASVLEQALGAMMKIANEENIVSLSMPAVGTGFHKYTPELVAEITARVLARHAISGTSIRWIRICVDNEALKAVFLKELEKQVGLGWGPSANALHPAALTVLPNGRVSLDCRMSFPADVMEIVKIGHECEHQDDKWSWHFVDPWLQCWRGNHLGLFTFALRLAQHGDRMYIAESWVDGGLVENRIFGVLKDIRRLAETICRWTTSDEAGKFHDPLAVQDFSIRKMTGKVDLEVVTFKGETDSSNELREMANHLLAQADRLDALPPFPTFAMNTSERFQGCLLGLACGDAVGTTVEFKMRGTFQPVTDMIGGGPFKLEPGQWTDDTSMALCLAASLTELGGFSASDQMSRYLRWFETGYMSSNGHCFDVGRTVRLALSRYKQSSEAFSGPTSPDTAGNGALMRLAPVVMFFYPDRSKAISMSEESTRTTHGATECIEASRLFSAMLINALAGSNKEGILLGHGITHLMSPGLVSVANGGYFTKQDDEIKGSGYVVQSLEAALWCFWTTSSFEDAVLKAANLGDDADTTAAICGQVAGAYYGGSNIPEKWLRCISMNQEIGDLAEHLRQIGASE